MKKPSKLSPHDLPTGWIRVAAVLLFISLLASVAIAYYHDAVSSALEMRELIKTGIWFRVSTALTVFSLLAFVELFVYSLTAAKFNKPAVNPEPGKESSAQSTSIEQPVQKPINEARLRSIFDSTSMNQWSDDPGKSAKNRQKLT